MSSLLDKVKTIVAEKLSVDESEVVPTASFTEDLNDSTTIDISDEHAESISTVQEALDYLKSNGVKE